MRMSDWSSDVCSSDLAVKRATDRSLSAVQLVFVVLAGDIECRTAAGINAKERAPQGMACGQLLTQQGFARAAGAGEIGCLPVRDVAGPRPLPLGGLNVLPLRGINQRQQAGDLAPFILGAEQERKRTRM